VSGSPEPQPVADERQRLLAALAAIEAQRPVLGDETTAMAQAPLRQLLARLDEPQLRRAQVTVLFADIVDSTALASRLDAEDVLQVFGRLLERAAACVRAQGGRVLRYTGDGLKAGFGTQGTREDDAARAVLAGLDILAAAREHASWVATEFGITDFAVRVGAHTGEVALGAGFEADNTLTGDTVNLAARMEQAAPRGGLRVSAETWAHVRGRFEGEPQPPLAVKGAAQPMLTWLVHAARGGEGPERGIAGLAVPLVGRTPELAALRSALAAARQGHPQAVTVLADAGVGKTRLLRELLAEAGAAGAWVLAARAQPGSELRLWGLLQALLMAHAGVGDGDSAETARHRLVATLTPELAATGDAAGAEPKAQRIGQLLGLDFGDVPALLGLDARALRDLALAALIDWLAGLARTRAPGPVVLVFEDLHWADEASLDALAHWMAQLTGLPLLLLMSTRPALLERRPAWCETAAPGAGPVIAPSRLPLAPLPEAARGMLADALLQRIAQPPERLRRLLVERAEGNPYYMEELLRRLLDDGAIAREGEAWRVDEPRLDRLRLPTTLVGLLQARLDALPAAERQGAQRASIVGHVFWDAALAQIDPAAPGALAELQRRQWLRPRASSAFDDTAERQFDHHLLHQVTYDTVLKDERRRGHAAVARWLAERTAGRAPEFLAITGEHAERAGDTALAADCFERAAAEAARRFATTLAIDCLQRALRLVPADDHPRRHRLLDSLYDEADKLGDRALQQQTLDAHLALLAQHPDPQREAALRADRALLADRLGDAEAAFRLATEAAALAEAAGNDDAAALAHAELCWLHGQRMTLDDARRHQALALAAAARVRDSNPKREVTVLVLAAVVDILANRYLEARAQLEQVLVRAEAADLPRSQLGALNYLCSVSIGLGEFDRAVDEADRFLALAQRLGHVTQTGAAHYMRALALMERGDHAAGLAAVAEALPLLRASQSRLMEADTLNIRGHAHAAAGNAAAAREAFEQARQVYEAMEPGGPRGLSRRALMAEQDLALGDLAAARAHVDAVLAGLVGDAGAAVESLHDAPTVHWACHRVLQAAGDARAGPLLEGLRARLWPQLERRAGGAAAAAGLVQRSRLLRQVFAGAAGGGAQG